MRAVCWRAIRRKQWTDNYYKLRSLELWNENQREVKKGS